MGDDKIKMRGGKEKGSIWFLNFDGEAKEEVIGYTVKIVEDEPSSNQEERHIPRMRILFPKND